MNIYFLTNARIPNRKAHVAQIHRMSDAFLSLGHGLKLLHPERKNPYQPEVDDPKENYNLDHSIDHKALWCWDNLFLKESFARVWFLVRSFTYALSVLVYFLRESSGSDRERMIVYSRERFGTLLLLLLKPFLDLPVIVELHQFPESMKTPLRTLWNRSDGFVVLNKQLKKILRGHGIPETKQLVEYDAVDLEEFDLDCTVNTARNRIDVQHFGPMATYVGRFHTMGMEKGIRTSIEASEDVLNDHPDLKFLFVGGPLKKSQQYRDLIEEKNLPADRFEFRDYQPPTEIPYFLKASTLLLMPFPWTEHFAYYMSPLKLFEYMASRRPIVASNLPSLRELLEDGKNAFLAEPGDPKSVARSINDILDHPERAETVAKRAFEQVGEHTWIRRAERVSRFIEDRLSERSHDS